MKQEPRLAVQPTNKGVTIVDPLQGKASDLPYQWMIAHPCEVIAEHADWYKQDDSTAVKISNTFAKTKAQTLPASVRATTARVEAADLFEPNYVSGNKKLLELLGEIDHDQGL